MATEPRLGDMGTSGFSFKLQCVDSQSAARRGVFQTPRGVIDTPAFMPVATVGSVKGLEVERIQATGTKMVLANTYHLALRPGEEIVQQIGGLHAFMGWQGPILTDSGGFQIFSLARLTRVSDDGAEFRAHTDGRLMRLSPETAVLIQEKLGSDVAMVLDHVVSLPSERSKVNDACERTVLWAQRCRQAHKRSNQILFAIVQGGLEPDLRVRCAEELMKLDFPGYAIGGLSVGETPEDMYHMLDVTCPVLPADRPRYLMGVGRPVDLLHAIGRGVDLFDCVMPTRNGRNALAFTSNGTLRLRNEVHKSDPRPIENECPCPACRHSRAYIRHLFMAKEMLGPILLSSHNLTFYQRLMGEARQAISEHQFASFSDEMTRKLRPNGKGA